MDAPATPAQHCALMGQPPDQPAKDKGLSAHQAGLFAPHGKVTYDPDATTPERPGGLTPREGEIVELLVQEYTNEEISKETKIKIATVKSHVHNILDKIGGKTRSSAIIWTLRGQLAERDRQIEARDRQIEARDRQIEARDREILILKELLAKQGSSGASETKPD